MDRDVIAITARYVCNSYSVVYVHTYRVYIETNHCVRHGSKAVLGKTGWIEFRWIMISAFAEGDGEKRESAEGGEEGPRMIDEGGQDPSPRGQFSIFGTVSKTVDPPTETRAKTLRTTDCYCSPHHPTKAGG